MQLEFLGAAGTVTGSRYLLTVGERRVLIDCGLFQGVKALRELNWKPLPAHALAADVVLLTHAHIDHSGYLPVFCRSGFRGKVVATSATVDLCSILLPDAAHLQEEDARRANKRRYSKHAPALPLFTLDDAKRALTFLSPVPLEKSIEVVPGISATFHPSGHILGASSIEVCAEGQTILFSGDLGRSEDLLMLPPSQLKGADYVVVESTYGDRRHNDAVDVEDQLAEVINEASAQGGVVMVPAFAVGRAQALLFHIHRLKAARRIADLPVFLNSPMASRVLPVFQCHLGEHRLSAAECAAMCNTASIVESVEESKALNERKGPMIIIAGSGMATGGRITHHLRQFAPDPKNTILLVGYQAGGTRGQSLATGCDMLTMFGEEVPIRAKVVQMHQFSAHADYTEILNWLSSFTSAPRRVFITHGEPTASDALRHRIDRVLKWRTVVPRAGQVEQLGS